jgi:cell division septum initiation protein DivIVA
MDDTRFIKTVAFGGFDKADVLAHLENLNGQVYSLKNELRDAKYLLEAYRIGSTTEKACETALAEERAILSKYQVANETLSTKLTTALEENNTCQQKIKALKKEIDDLNAKLKNQGDMIIALQAGSEAAALGNVFIEAQKASDMLVGEAKSKAAQINYDAKKAADDTVAGANQIAEKIIRDAERTAADTVSDAEKKAEEIAAASDSVRNAVTQNADILAKGIGTLRYLLDDLSRTSSSALGQSEKLLSDMSVAIGGERFDDADYDEDEDNEQGNAPVQTAVHAAAPPKQEEDAQKNDSSPAPSPAHHADNKAQGGNKHQGDKNKKGKIDLAALAAQANAIKKK